MSLNPNPRPVVSVSLRPASPEDFEGVLALLHQLWPDKILHPERLRPLFERVLTTRQYQTAHIDGRLVGFGGVSIRDNLWQEGQIAYVEELVVDETCRGSGIGTAIMDRLLAIAREQGCKRFELDSGFHRISAHEFYHKRGMQKRAFLFSQIP